MFRRFDICIVLFLLLNACYWVVVSAVNSCAAPYAYLMLPAVFIVPCAVFLNAPSMAAVIVPSSLMFALSSAEKPFAICAVWCALGFVVNAWRFKFRTLDWLSCVMLMQLVNAAALLAYALVLPCGCPGFIEFLRRFALDFSVSAAALCVCGNFCVWLPVDIAGFFGVDITMNEDI